MDYQTPDLAAVLRTLAAYAPPSTIQSGPNQSFTQDPSIPPTGTVSTEDLEEGEYVPLEPSIIFAQRCNTPLLSEDTIPRAIPQHRSPLSKPPPIDSATITDWPTGLRCMMKTVARNDAILARIRKMINVQHEHEKQWWEGRQALVAKQEARKEGKKKLDEVLRSVGGNIPSSSTVSTPEEDTAELLRYDRKVHRACTEMVEAMSAEFKTFGVPFFGTKDNLIGETGNGFKAAEVDVSREEDGKRILGGKLTTTGLIDLQKRMLELLEDMCQE